MSVLGLAPFFLLHPQLRAKFGIKNIRKSVFRFLLYTILIFAKIRFQHTQKTHKDFFIH